MDNTDFDIALTDAPPATLRDELGKGLRAFNIELLGPIETRDLPVVVSAAFADQDLIGMNFLSRLGSWRVESRTLILNPPEDSDLT